MSGQVRVALVAPIFNNLPVWAADELGFFGQAGLDVGIDVLYGVAKVTDALLQRQADVAIGSPESVLGATGAELLIVAGNARNAANTLIGRRGITSIEQLRGATIGVSHAQEGTALLVTEMLGRHGMRPGRDFRLEAIGVASARWEKLQAGTLDAGLQTSPHKYLAVDEGYPNLGDIADVVPDYQFTTVNVRRDWAEGERDVLRRFLHGVARGTRWLLDSPDAAVALAAERLGTTEEYARRDYDDAVARTTLTADLRLSDAGLAKVVEVMRAAGTLDVTDASERIDLSYLPSADRPVPA